MSVTFNAQTLKSAYVNVFEQQQYHGLFKRHLSPLEKDMMQ